MTRRILHFRHPNGASDVPFCDQNAEDRLCTTRTHEVECVRCRKLIREDRPRQKVFRQIQREAFLNVSRALAQQIAPMMKVLRERQRQKGV